MSGEGQWITEQRGSATVVHHVTPKMQGQGAIPAGTPEPHIGKTSLSYTTGGNEVSSKGYASYTAGRDDPKPTSVMQTAKQQNGRLTVELIPGDPSSRTLIDQALRDGLVYQSAPGVYIDAKAGGPAGTQQAAPAGTQQSPEVASQAPDVTAGGLFDKADVEAWDADIADVPQAAYDGAVARSIAATVAGAESLDHVALALARDGGLDPAHASELVTAAVEWHQHIADTAIVQMGIAAEQLPEAYAWMRQTHGTALRHGIQEFVMKRDFSVIRRLAREWQTTQGRR